MPSPFPGMNPYLENPELWTEVHSRLIVAIADEIAPTLPSQYRVAVEKRIYLCESARSELVGIPDLSITTQKFARGESAAVATLPSQSEVVEVEVPTIEEVREAYLEIRDVESQVVVTAIELLSPTNKRAGVGRDRYEEKRREILASPTHLVEIDLLKNGKPMPILGEIPNADYRILIARGNYRPRAQLYVCNLQQAIPEFPIPLRREENEPTLNLQNLLLELYDRARFDLAIDYTLEPIPPLKPEAKIWADALLREKGLRGGNNNRE